MNASLLPAQHHTLARAISCLDTRGAVLLANPLGAGKTYVACALAGHHLRHQPNAQIIAVVPARLRSMWSKVAHLFDLTPTIASHREASLDALPRPRDALWIIDEAHRFRNPHTRRYRHLARALGHHPVVLISATPLHLSPRDVEALLDLVAPAESYDTLALRSQLASPSFTVERISIEASLGPHAPALLDALAGLHLPVFGLSDESAARALLRDLLIARVCSHPVALLRSLERLHRYYARCTTPQGTILDRAEFRALFGVQGPVQGLLPFAWPETPLQGKQQPSEIAQSLGRIMRRVKAHLRTHEGPSALEDVLSQHLGERAAQGPRAVLFTQYSETAQHVARALQNRWSCGLLTGSRSRWNGLPAQPSALLDAMAPSPPKSAPHLQILVCTDVLGEGHNLQGASLLVHLDRPWNPVRIRQREGRILRLGQRSTRVCVATVVPRAEHPLLEGYLQRLERALSQRGELARRLDEDVLRVEAPQDRAFAERTLAPVYRRIRAFRRHPNASTWMHRAADLRRRLARPLRVGLRMALEALDLEPLHPEAALAAVEAILPGRHPQPPPWRKGWETLELPVSQAASGSAVNDAAVDSQGR